MCHSFLLAESQKVDINRLIKEEKLVASVNCDFDIGSLENIFDSKQYSLARTPSVNPLIITLDFNKDLNFTRQSFYCTHGDYKISLESALTKQDLDSKTGSWIQVMDSANCPDSKLLDSSVIFPGRYLKITVLRTTGDNYVHLNEWSIYADLNVNSINIKSSPIQLNEGNIRFFPKLEITNELYTDVIPTSRETWRPDTDIIIIKDDFFIGANAGEAFIKCTYQNIIDSINVSVTSLRQDTLGDISIEYAELYPNYNYLVDSPNPKIDGKPKLGDTVVWKHHIASISNKTIPFKFTLYNNFEEIFSKDTIISPYDRIVIERKAIWDTIRQEFSAKIERTDGDDFNPDNNTFLYHSDALMVGFWVEETMYNYFLNYQSALKAGSSSWQDWANRHVKRWNKMFADAKYELSPDGVLDRMRIQKVVIVADGSLPLNGGLATNSPDKNDKTVDLQWGFPKQLIDDGGLYTNTNEQSDSNPFFYEGSLLHELGHARYLIDLYGFNVHDNGSGNTIALEEMGGKIIGTQYMPFIANDAVHYTRFKGLMNGEYDRIDEYSAAAMNLITGNRASNGNYNAPANIGSFKQDLPENNIVKFVDSLGFPIANAKVSLYTALPQTDVWYGKYYDNLPDLVVFTDNVGEVNLGRCPFYSTGKIIHGYGFSNAVLLVKLEKFNNFGFAFIESSEFNLEYWKGNKVSANYTTPVKLFVNTSISETAQYPIVNQYNDFITVETLSHETAVSIYNLQGERLSDKSYTGTNIIVDLTNFSSGLYALRIQSEGKAIIKTIVLNK